MSTTDERNAAVELESAPLSSPLIKRIFDHWLALDLPDCWLVAGAVVQTYWNKVYNFSASHCINDIDLVYFDASDCSEASEAGHQRRIEALFADLDTQFDVKNEARVHFWYKQRFGIKIRPYRNIREAIESFPTIIGAIGVRPSAGGIEVLAPYGLEDFLSLTVRPNKLQISKGIYDAKTEPWKRLCPQLGDYIG